MKFSYTRKSGLPDAYERLNAMAENQRQKNIETQRNSLEFEGKATDNKLRKLELEQAMKAVEKANAKENNLSTWEKLASRDRAKRLKEIEDEEADYDIQQRKQQLNRRRSNTDSRSPLDVESERLETELGSKQRNARAKANLWRLEDAKRRGGSYDALGKALSEFV